MKSCNPIKIQRKLHTKIHPKKLARTEQHTKQIEYRIHSPEKCKSCWFFLQIFMDIIWRPFDTKLKILTCGVFAEFFCCLFFVTSLFLFSQLLDSQDSSQPQHRSSRLTQLNCRTLSWTTLQYGLGTGMRALCCARCKIFIILIRSQRTVFLLCATPVLPFSSSLHPFCLFLQAFLRITLYSGSPRKPPYL